MKPSIFTQPSECSGCQACVEVCPKHCITMFKDKEHFVYPFVDENLCIDCHRCEKVCPFKDCSLNIVQSAAVGVHSREEEIFKSSSGGAFWALCQILIPQGYVVAGVKWTDDFRVVHDIAYTLEDAQAFRKSKYIMSDTNGVYFKIKSLLKEGRKIMFSGSPCQVAACKKIIGENENLLLVDLVCHGAPNQDIFNKEVEYLEKKHKGKLNYFEFRQKKNIAGKVNSRSARYIIGDKEYIVGINDDPFLKGYYTRLFYRPSCGTCHFARPERIGDITIADAWGVNELFENFNDLSGTSTILFNTDKGNMVKDHLHAYMSLRSVPVQWVIDSNQQLRSPTIMHSNRHVFFSHIEQESIFQAVKLAQPTSIFMLLKKFLKLVLNKL